MGLYFNGKVDVKRAKEGKMHPSLDFGIPTVVMMKPEYYRYVPHQKKNISPKKKRILLRDNYKCQYCDTRAGPEKLNIDHVVPKAKGGKSEWNNLVASCIRCNNDKDCRTPKQAGMILRRKPGKPNFLVFTIHRHVKDVPEDWRSFLYWNVELEDN